MCQDGQINDAVLTRAVGDQLTSYNRDGTAKCRLLVLNSAIWGFVSDCLSGEAETIIRQGGGAAVLQGMDAWRRIVRFIDRGFGIRLELPRNKCRMLRSKTIENLKVIIIIGLA